MYISRSIESIISEYGLDFPVVGITGLRQTGKSTLVKHISKQLDKPVLLLDLEKVSDRDKLANPELFFRQHRDKCLIIDEIQLHPELFSIMRPEIDEHRVPLRFIVTGSASPTLLKQGSESLAGRIAFVELGPFNAKELMDENKWELSRHHFLGGFPDAFLKSDKSAVLWLDQFIKAYTERDLPYFDFPAIPQDIYRFWEMIAWQHGQILNLSSLSNSFGVSVNTVKKYLRILENTLIINLLQPYFHNPKKRLIKSPKVYLSDTGILHRLLRIQSFDQLQGMPVLGSSWENYVYNQIKSIKSSEIDLFFYRTLAGAEADLVMSIGDRILAVIEIKYGDIPSVSRGFYNVIDDLKSKRNYIIIPETDPYQKRGDIWVYSIKDFLLGPLLNELNV